MAGEKNLTEQRLGLLPRFGQFLFGAAPQDNPPERVRAAIARQQYQSEILIGWVQLVVVLTFGTLYGVSPKTFSEAMFAPVPWALAAYAGFTVLRLVLAYADILPRWFLALSVVIDMTLLMGLIWSFHLQYEQPPAFFLKAPTILYVFIFIALRALRFEAAFVVLAGIVAVLGWMGLVFYVVQVDGMDAITRDYVEYMTSASLLLGAEFDKAMSILVVTGVLAVAIVRARRLLIRSATEEAAAEDLSRFLPSELAAQITTSENRIHAGEGELTEAAILTCDLRDFTKFSMDCPPHQIMTLLNDYQARMVAIINRHGGVVDKFPGDGIMVMFNTVKKSPTFAADALRCVDEMAAEAEAWANERGAAGDEPIEVVFSVAAGPVLFGAVGDDTRLEYTVIGDAGNVAAKLEKHTRDEAVHGLTTRASYDQAVAQGYQPAEEKEIRPARSIGGLGEPVDLVVLVP